MRDTPYGCDNFHGGGGKISCLFGEGAEFLIITYDGYYDQACSLAEWKCSKGILSKVTTLTEINLSGTPTKDEIKNYIHIAYTEWNPQPRYVLLLGDVGRIECWWIIDSPQDATDNPYGNMDEDFHAEIAVGRFAVDDLTDCCTAVAKTLCYERNPWMSAPSWLHSATLVLNEDTGTNESYYATCDHINAILTSYWGPSGHVDYFKDVAGDDA